jgi:saposin
LPAPLSASCRALVDPSISNIIKLVEQGVASLDICKKAGICGTRKRNSQILLNEEVLKQVDNDVACDLCKQVVKYVEKLVLEELFEDEIIRLVNQLCDTMPPPLSTYCRDIIDQWIHEIVKLLEEGIDHLEICKRIKLCNMKYVPLVKNDEAENRSEVIKMLAKTGACDMCKSIVQYVEQLVIEGILEEEILLLVNSLCDTLPRPISKICRQTADKYIRDIIKQIEAGLTPQAVCASLGFC